MAKYTDTKLVLEAFTYPKAMIRVYVKNELIQSIPVKWENRYEAMDKLYKQYRENLKSIKGDNDGYRG